MTWSYETYVVLDIKGKKKNRKHCYSSKPMNQTKEHENEAAV